MAGLFLAFVLSQIYVSSASAQTTFLAPAASSPTVNFSSITWTRVQNSTYTAVLSTTSNFLVNLSSNQIFANATAYFNLSINTTYYFRVKISTEGDPSFDTSTFVTAVTSPSVHGFQIYTGSISVTLSPNGNSTGTILAISTAANFNAAASSSALCTASNLSLSLNGLSSNSIYTIFTRAFNGMSASTITAASTSTLVADPGAVTVASASASSITITWGNNGNPLTPPTSYEIQVSTWSGFSGVLTSSITFVVGGSTVGLLSGTSYFFRVRAFGIGGDTSAFTSSVSTMTLSTGSATNLNPSFFSVQFTTLAVSWNSIPGNTYIAVISTDSLFTVRLASGALAGTATGYSGLSSATTYYFKVKISTEGDSSYTSPVISTVTLSTSTFTDLNPAFSGIMQTSFTVSWTSIVNSTYVAVLAIDSGFSGILSSTTYLGTNTTGFTGLLSFSTYYFEVKLATEGDTSYTNPPISTKTLAYATTTNLNPSFFSVQATTVAVSWNFIFGNTYVAVFSTSSNFVPAISSGALAGISTGYSNLAQGTSYYFKVKISTEGDLGYVSVSTVTNSISTALSPAFSGVTLSSLTVSWTSVSGSNYNAVISTDSSFVVSLSSSLLLGLNTTGYSGLSSAVTYYFKVKISTEGDSAYTSPAISTVTLSTTTITNLNPAFSGVTQSSLTVSWTSIVNSTYVAVLAIDSGFSGILSSTTYLGTNTTGFTGLLSFSTYYFEVKLATEGDTAYTNPPISTKTLAYATTTNLNPSFFSVQQTTVAVSWNFIFGNTYVAVFSTSSNFVPSISSGALAGISTGYSSLSQGTSYYFKVKISTEGDSAYTSPAISTVTLSTTTITNLNPAFSGITQTSFTVSWTSIVNSTYVAVLAIDSGFSGILSSTTYLGTNTTGFTGLLSFSTYYFEVKLATEGDTSYTNPPISTKTLAYATTTNLNPSFFSVQATTVAVSWNFIFGNTYVAVFSTSSNFVPAISSGALAGISTGYSNLAQGTSYYFKVKISTEGDLGYVSVSTVTLSATSATNLNPSFTNVTYSSISVSWTNISASTYNAVISTASNFSVVTSSGRIFANTTGYSNLSANSTYYFQVKLSTEGDSAYSSVISTVIPITTTKVWSGNGADNLASNAQNWVGGLPINGDIVKFNATNASKACHWDLSSVQISSMILEVGYSSTVVLVSSLTMSGDLTVSAGHFIGAASTVAFNGALNSLVSLSAQSTLGTVYVDKQDNSSPYNNGRVKLVAPIDIKGNIVVVGGLLMPDSLSGQGDIHYRGNITLLSGSLTLSNIFSTATFSGSSAQTISNPGGSFGGLGYLRISNSAGVTFSSSVGSLSINTDLTIDTGAILLGGGVAFDVTRHWLSSGSFIPQSSTVSFVGSSAQTVHGNNFDYIRVTNSGASGVTFKSSFTTTGFTDITSNSKLFFLSGTTYTIGSLNLRGTSGSPVQLRSFSGVLQNYFNVAAATVSFVDVSDNHATGITLSAGGGSIDTGNNTNWSFAPGSLSGTISYPGSSSGNYKIRLTTSASITASTAAGTTEQLLSGVTTFSFSGIPSGTYYLRAFKDVNANGSWDSDSEPFGQAGTFNAPTAYNVTSGTSIAGTAVKIYDRRPILPNQTFSGLMSSTGTLAVERGSGYYGEWATFFANAGQSFQIDETAVGFTDTYLYLFSSTGGLIAANDDVAPGSNSNSRIVSTATVSGTHHILAATFAAGGSGAYNLSLTFNGSSLSDVPSNSRINRTSSSTVNAMWNSVSASSYTVALSTDLLFSSLISSSTLNSSGVNSTTFTSLSPSTTYYFKVKISTQPDYNYTPAISTVTSSLGSGLGQISGSINYTGNNSSGSFRVRLSTVSTPEPVLFSSTTEQNLGSFSTFTFTSLSDGVYFLRAYKDANGNTNLDALTEPQGVHSSTGFVPIAVVITGGSVASGKVVDVADTRFLGSGQSVTDSLVSTGTVAKIRGAGYYGKIFSIYGLKDQTITADMTALASNWNTYLYLLNENGVLLTSDDDSGGSLNAKISGYVLPSSGTYYLVATSYASGVTGSFTLSLNVSGGLTTLAGTVSHPHSGVAGPYRIEVSSSSAFSTVSFSSVVAQGAGTSASYSIQGLAANVTYYVRSWVDIDSDTVIDSTEPVSSLGGSGFPQTPFGTRTVTDHVSSNASFFSTAAIGTAVYAEIVLSTSGTSGANIYTEDRGAISGTISQTSTQTGTIVMWVAKDTVTAGGSFSDGRNFNHRDITVASTGTYSVGNLNPGRYFVQAFRDTNGNQVQDSFEDYGSSYSVIVSSYLFTPNVNLTIAGVSVPQTPSGFSGVAQSSWQVKWSWNDVSGETGYRLRDISSSTVYSLTQDATFYLETFSGNANSSSTVRMLHAFNSQGSGGSLISSSVYTLANAPGVPVFGGVGASTIAVSWSANGNSSGTKYELYRGTASAATFGLLLSTTATSFIDSGLVPSSSYYYKVDAVNANGFVSTFSAVGFSSTTASPPGVGSIEGVVNYAGRQGGNILVQVSTSSNFTPSSATLTLPNLASQNYFFGSLSTNVTYYVQAFVDVSAAGAKSANNTFDTGEDRGLYGGTTGPSLILVSSSETGKNITISVDVTSPSAPIGLNAAFTSGVNRVGLSWSAPTVNMGGTTLVDLWGYEVERSVAGGAYSLISDTTTPYAQTSFVDNTPASGQNIYRVRAVDWGRNGSPFSGTYQITVATIGLISGSLNYRGNTAPGLFRIELSTSSNPSITYSQVTSTLTGNTFTFGSVPEGAYYLRAYRDTMGPLTVWQSSGEPAGADGPFANPFPVIITGGQQVTGRSIMISDRRLITSGQTLTGSLEDQTIISTQPAALERGSNFLGKYYTLNGTAGQQITITLTGIADNGPNVNQPSNDWDTYLYLIGPNGGIIAQDDDGAGSGNSKISNYTLPASGVYHILATSYGSNVTGGFTLALQTVGGFPGGVSGLVTYNGVQSGAMRVSLHQGSDKDAPAIKFATAAAVSANQFLYNFPSVDDGSYFVRAFRDTNANGNSDSSEPFGESSVLTVSGSTAVANFTAQDPLSISGSVAYSGSVTGSLNLRLVESGVTKVLVKSTDTSFPQNYVIKVATAGVYDLEMFLDQNSNNAVDFLEPFASSSSINLTQAIKDVTGVNLTLAIAGEGDTSKNSGSITGTLTYSGSVAPSGSLVVGFATDNEFQNIVYTTGIASQGATFANAPYISSGMASGTSYYVAAFRDKNGNGSYDPDEPIGAYGLVNNDWNSLPFTLVGSTEMSGRNVTLIDPATGFISGIVAYYGNQSGDIIVNAGIDNFNGVGYFGSTTIARINGQTTYFYQINSLASSSTFEVNGFVDVNADGDNNFGEPFAFLSNVSVSTTSSSGTVGQNLVLLDPGAFGGGTLGVISGVVDSSGTRSGTLYVTLHSESDFSDEPITTVAGTSLGASSYSFTFSDVPLGTYYLRAFKDGNSNQEIDPSFEENGDYGSPTAITLSASNLSVSNVRFYTYDPGSSAGSGSAGNIISGAVINRSGVSSGNLVIELLSAGASFTTPPTRSTSIASYSSSQTFTFTNVPEGDYFLRAFIDADSNFIPGATEPAGRNPIGYYSGGTLGSQNFDVGTVTALTAGADVFGNLSSTDTRSSDRGNDAYYDMYSFTASRGDVVTIAMTAQNFTDTFLYLLGPSGEVVTTDDDSGGALNARIVSFSVEESGIQRVIAASYAGGVTGIYKIRLDASSGGTGTIAGRVTYSGSQGGKVIVGVFDTDPSAGDVAPSDTLELPGATNYIFSDLVSSRTYYIGGFIDVNSNGVPDDEEPKGFYGPTGAAQGLFLNQDQTITGADFELTDSTQSLVNPSQTGLMTGQISFTGSQSGPVNVEIWGTPSFTGSPIANRRIDPFSSPASWDARVPAGAYFVRTWMDADGNFAFDNTTDPQGVYSPRGLGAEQIYVVAGSTSTGIDVVLRSANQIIIGGQVSTTTFAGEGQASISPSTVSVNQTLGQVQGGISRATFTVIVGANGISANGKVTLSWPQDAGIYSPVFSGAVTISTSPAGAVSHVIVTPNGSSHQVSEFQVDSQFGSIALRKISGGALAGGSTVQFVWVNGYSGCSVGTQTFKVATVSDGGGTPQDLTSGIQPRMEVLAGTPVNVTLGDGWLTVPSGSTGTASNPTTQDFTPLLLQLRDVCQNVVRATSSIVITSSATKFNASFQTVSDTTLFFSTRSFTSGGVTVATGPWQSLMSFTVPANRSTATVYMVATQAGSKNIRVTNNLTPFQFFTGVSVLGANLTNVSVSTASAPMPGTTRVTINPSSTSANSAFITFNPNDDTVGWRVAVSSLPWPTSDDVLRGRSMPTPLWETNGTGTPLYPIVWDGHYAPWINFGSIVPSGLYYVRIELAGSSIRDDSLQVSVAVPTLTGSVSDSVNPLVKLTGVLVQASGPQFAQAYTDSVGTYSISGLTPGTYYMNFTKQGYLDKSTTVVVGANGGLFSITMDQASALKISGSVAGSTQSFDQWGSLTVVKKNPSTGEKDWDRSYYASMRVAAGSTTIDDGGRWDSTISQFLVQDRIKIDIIPGSTYFIDAFISGYGSVSTETYVGTGVTNFTLPVLTRKPNLSGYVWLPLVSSGTWVSIEARPASTGTYNYGGTYILQGRSSETFTLSGMEPGDYTLIGRAEGFNESSRTVTVGSTDLFRIDIPTFTQGATLTGLFVVSGSSSLLVQTAQNAVASGFQTSSGIGGNISLWAPQTGQRTPRFSFTISTGGVAGISGQNAVASGTYVIDGVNPGSYQYFPWFYDMLKFAPSTANAASVSVSAASVQTGPTIRFAQATSIISGRVRIPAGQTDFSNVLMRIPVSPNRVRNALLQGQSIDPNQVTVTSLQSGMDVFVTPYAADASLASFQSLASEVDQQDITFIYTTNGQSVRKVFVTTKDATVDLGEIDLSGQTYSITGTLEDGIIDPRFDTMGEIVATAARTDDGTSFGGFGTNRFVSPSGYPAGISSTTARIQAVRRDVNNAQSSLVNVTQFDQANTRIGFMTSAGTYSISGITPGIWSVHTFDLKDSSGNLVAPFQEKTVVVSNSSPTVNFRLTGGFTVSGTLSLAKSKQDARNLLIAVKNRKGDVVALSSNTSIGNPASGVTANSVNYSFSGLPAGQVYTLQVFDRTAPVRYVAKPLKAPDPSTDPTGAGLQGNLSGQNITLVEAGSIKARLRDANTGRIVSARNKTILAPNFRIFAVANPWIDGGFTELSSTQTVLITTSVPQARDLIADDGTFTLSPIFPDAACDLHLEQDSWSLDYLAQGSQNFSPVTLSGLRLNEGEIKDLGTVDLNQGTSITGSVQNSAGQGLANIKILAKPALVDSSIFGESRTDANGEYKLWVSSFVSRYYDVTAAPRQENEANSSQAGNLFAEKSVRLDLKSQTTANFTLSPANFIVRGSVSTNDGGELKIPFGANLGFPGAAVVMQLAGVPPSGSNPLGDIVAFTDATGTFAIPRLSSGTYLLKSAGVGYEVRTTTVIITNSDVSVSTSETQLTRGAVVTGTIRKPDRSSASGYGPVSRSEVNAVAATDRTFSEFIFGTVDVDPIAKTISKYSITGFKIGKTYTLVFFPEKAGDDIVFPEEGYDTISFNSSESTTTKTVNLTYKPVVADVSAVAKKVGGNYQIKFSATQSLRNRTGNDNDLNRIIAVSAVSSTGTVLVSPNSGGTFLTASGSSRTLSDNRKEVTAIYSPAANESRFSIRFKAFTNVRSPQTGDDIEIDKIFDFYAGVDAESREKVSNARGGKIEMEAAGDEAENSGVTFEAGTFVNESDLTPNPTSQVTCGIARASDVAQSTQTSKNRGAPGFVDPDDFSKYPPALAGAIAAMRKIKSESEQSIQVRGAPGLRGAASNASDVATNVLGSFYDFFLPAGVKRSLSKNAKISIQYSTSTGSDSTMNVYFYNDTSSTMTTTSGIAVPPGAYGIENTNKVVDSVNKKISVSVNHFTVFVVVNSTSDTLGAGTTIGGSGATTATFTKGSVNLLSLTAGTTVTVSGIPVSGGSDESHSFCLISTGAANGGIVMTVQSRLQTFSVAVNQETLLDLNDDALKDLSMKVTGIAGNVATISLGGVLQAPTTLGYAGTELEAFNFPNPFNATRRGFVSAAIKTQGQLPIYVEGATAIRYALPSVLGSADVRVTCEIYDVAGELVRRMDFGYKNTGKYHYADWDGKNENGETVASGVYIGRITVQGSSKSKTFKMAVIK